MSTLHAWLADAWKRHDTQSRPLADELLARVATLPDDADGAEAVRLARHVMLGHLGDTAALRHFLAALAGGSTLQPMRERAEWALGTLEGQPTPALPESVTWNLLADVALAEIVAGRLADARQRMLAPEAAAATHPDEAARRAYAITTYNVTLALRTGPRSPERDALMLELAALERRAWSRAGTWLQVERADYHLALCHAVVGDGAAAQRHAAACRDACEAHGADAAERFFAHECSVHAARAARDAAAADAHLAQMRTLLAQVDDAETKAFCEETLAATLLPRAA